MTVDWPGDEGDEAAEVVREFRRNVQILAASPERAFKKQLELVGFPDARLTGLDWSGVDFSGEDLTNLDFSDCDLRGASFDNADVRGARFVRATLDDDALAFAQNAEWAIYSDGEIGIYVNIHLVSDSTGETLSGTWAAAKFRFDRILPVEHTYYLVRSSRQLDRVLREIEGAPGIVMFTLANLEHRVRLEEHCTEIGLPCVPVLDNAIDIVSRYLGLEINHHVEPTRVLNAEYFRRLEALEFVMQGDDGQSEADLGQAEVILVGVKGASVAPTAIYVAHQGVKAAGVSISQETQLPAQLFDPDRPLIVGLTMSPDALLQAGHDRLTETEEAEARDDADENKLEVMEAQALFEREGWPVIDVTDCSIEDTAARILILLKEHRA